MIRALYFNKIFFQSIGIIITLFIIAFIFPVIIALPKLLSLGMFTLLIVDLLLLFSVRKGVIGERTSADRLSNGDDNLIQASLENFYRFPVRLSVIDEIPFQFQKRDHQYDIRVESRAIKKINYKLRPVKRGEYSFGALNAYASSPLGFLSRRFRFSIDKMVPVYPSYIQMRKYELMAISNKLTETGIKKIRRIGHNLEFELIKEYVPGDDYRTINWKATARRQHLMVNHYQDERSQQVYCLIDKGRVMQMPFNGMSLLDYAINASLVISNIAIKKSDKAGLITFQDKIGTTLPASKRNKQMMQIMEVLYNQKTAYRESDFSVLYSHVRRKITQRSLLLLFTNFESIYGLHRQLAYIKSLSRQHLVVVIFFENTEVTKLIDQQATDLREVYYKAVAEKFNFEKKLIVKELNKNGVQALLTSPEKLTVNTINKYLELKARGMI
jgi:uncharacterized protein (DUF58 family)